MVKYLIKKKMKNEVKEHNKKALVYTTVALAGVGAYFSYRAVKNYYRAKELEEQQYLEDSEYEIYKHEEMLEKEREEKELKDKVDEFNSKRISYENSEHVSKEELESFVREAEEYKEEHENDEVDKEAYKEEVYDKYEYYDDDLSKDK